MSEILSAQSILLPGFPVSYKFVAVCNKDCMECSLSHGKGGNWKEEDTDNDLKAFCTDCTDLSILDGDTGVRKWDGL